MAQLLQALFSGSGSGSAEGRGLITDLLGGVLGANNDDLANTLTESTDSLTDDLEASVGVESVSEDHHSDNSL